MLKKRFMVDTNVFISAFKSGYTTTTKLLIKLLLDPETELIVNDILLDEYEKWLITLSEKISRKGDETCGRSTIYSLESFIQ